MLSFDHIFRKNFVKMITSCGIMMNMLHSNPFKYIHHSLQNLETGHWLIEWTTYNTPVGESRVSVAPEDDGHAGDEVDEDACSKAIVHLCSMSAQSAAILKLPQHDEVTGDPQCTAKNRKDQVLETWSHQTCHVSKFWNHSFWIIKQWQTKKYTKTCRKWYIQHFNTYKLWFKKKLNIQKKHKIKF